MGPLFLRNDFHQIELNLDGVIILRQTNSLAHPAHVSIDRDAGDSEGIPQNDIRRFSSHPGKGHQIFEGFLDFPPKSLHQFLAAFLDRFGFISVESGRSNLLLQFRQI